MKLLQTTVAIAILGLSSLGPSIPAHAQRPGEITLFSNTGFSGARFTITGRRETVNVPFRVRSVQVPAGEEWQLCTTANMRNCTTVRASLRDTSMIVRSAQPVPGISTLPAPAPGQSGQFGTSLQGMASEYFPRPQVNGQRVAAQGTAAGAESSANDFCRRAGWTRSAYQRLETVSGRNVIADVLCVRSM